MPRLRYWLPKVEKDSYVVSSMPIFARNAPTTNSNTVTIFDCLDNITTINNAKNRNTV